MKYNLVAILDNNSEKDFISIQRYLVKKYNLPYKNLPIISIPLVSFEKTYFPQVDEIIIKLLTQFKIFKFNFSTVVKYNEVCKNFALNVDCIGYVSRLNRCLVDQLSINNIKPVNFISSEKRTFIPIVNSNTENKHLENLDISFLLKKNYNLPSSSKIVALEVWKNMNQKNSVIKSYELNEI